MAKKNKAAKRGRNDDSAGSKAPAARGAGRGGVASPAANKAKKTEVAASAKKPAAPSPKRTASPKKSPASPKGASSPKASAAKKAAATPTPAKSKKKDEAPTPTPAKSPRPSAASVKKSSRRTGEREPEKLSLAPFPAAGCASLEVAPDGKSALHTGETDGERLLTINVPEGHESNKNGVLTCELAFDEPVRGIRYVSGVFIGAPRAEFPAFYAKQAAATENDDDAPAADVPAMGWIPLPLPGVSSGGKVALTVNHARGALSLAYSEAATGDELTSSVSYNSDKAGFASLIERPFSELVIGVSVYTRDTLVTISEPEAEQD